MPLSDEEARLLQQLEQSLAEEDPDFASTLRGSVFAARNRRVAVLGVLGFLGGIGLLFGGAVAALTWLGVIGFLLMLGSAYVVVGAWKRGALTAEDPRPATSGSSPGKPSGSFVDRMEERWQRRQDGDNS
ncbi:hypothetical protein HMPREF0063_11062 [Aeromicrobium marinum DSM 15272]|uniref:Gram-positive signal peptide protein, YSIRK family n=1 Tax=Aeromicrobium marinum DSM 15272 TaxID=585531 RepID=E2SAK4_9ACTN|nr:DUF3040 domain-containing protein [Aeromicrobium marinum]EFQ83400.1 hypothetical protein HMPREF0063_11062 [Aeromicrobium marinum DSM 15272]